MDSLQPGRSPSELPGFSAWLLEQNPDPLADQRAVEVGLLTCEQVLQPRQPFGLDGLVDLIVESGSRRARTRAVFEREGRRITDPLDEVDRVGKIAIGFAGKADDEIA